jgi:hypothetical protein
MQETSALPSNRTPSKSCNGERKGTTLNIQPRNGTALLAAAIVGTSLFALPASSAQAAAAMPKQDSPLVPLRAVSEAFQAQVNWNGAAQQVTVTRGDTVLMIQLGSTKGSRNGSEVHLDAAPTLENGRTMIPLSALSEAFRVRIEYDQQAGRVASVRSIGDLQGFVPQEVAQGNHAAYDLNVKMTEAGKVAVTAKINATNLSQDNWDKLVFYFIPNSFTAANQPPLLKDLADVKIDSVKLGGQTVAYTLDGDTLTIPTGAAMGQGAKADVEVTYHMTVPPDGIRLTSDNGNTYLTEWYPMLATYDHGWVKDEYNPMGESYHTAHSDFKVSYDVPQGYTVYSTAADDPQPGATTGVLTATNVKEFTLAIASDIRSVSKTVDGVEVRVFSHQDEPQEYVDRALKVATDSLDFYYNHIGPYPLKQLDVVMDGSGLMEYPGFVTVGSPQRLGENFENVVAHEIAHQWFYGVVTNDPYNEAWIDEGVTEFTASLYDLLGLHLREDQAFASAFRAPLNESMVQPANLPLSSYSRGYAVSVYWNPDYQLWNLFKRYGGSDTALKFLHDYYSTYPYKQVTSHEFARFAEAYFGVDHSYFTKWLKLD